MRNGVSRLFIRMILRFTSSDLVYPGNPQFNRLYQLAYIRFNVPKKRRIKVEKARRNTQEIRVYFIHPPSCQHAVRGSMCLHESKLASLLYSFVCRHCGKPLEGCGMRTHFQVLQDCVAAFLRTHLRGIDFEVVDAGSVHFSGPSMHAIGRRRVIRNLLFLQPRFAPAFPYNINRDIVSQQRGPADLPYGARNRTEFPEGHS